MRKMDRLTERIEITHSLSACWRGRIEGESKRVADGGTQRRIANVEGEREREGGTGVGEREGGREGENGVEQERDRHS